MNIGIPTTIHAVDATLAVTVCPAVGSVKFDVNVVKLLIPSAPLVPFTPGAPSVPGIFTD